MVGTALGDSAVNVPAMRLEKPTIVVLGNEGHGIRTNILRRCDQLVKIPYLGTASRPSASTLSATSKDGVVEETVGTVMAADVDSLNVSVSGGIILHHILSSRAMNTV